MNRRSSWFSWKTIHEEAGQTVKDGNAGKIGIQRVK